MLIAFSHSNAKTAAAITNAITQSYLREAVDADRRKQMDQLQLLEKAFDDAEEQLLAQQANLKQLVDSLSTGTDHVAVGQPSIDVETMRSDLKQTRRMKRWTWKRKSMHRAGRSAKSTSCDRVAIGRDSANPEHGRAAAHARLMQVWSAFCLEMLAVEMRQPMLHRTRSMAASR